PYDFARPGRLTAEAEQRVGGWLRGAAALAAKKAGKHLPAAPEVAVRGLEVQRPLDALEKLPDASVGYGVSFNAPAANAMLALPRPFALAVVGGMLGDTEGGTPDDRELTAVEQDLCEFFAADVIVGALQETWP